MNELFVNVKVDREERPDVDAIYMEAVQAMTGQRRLADDGVPARPTAGRSSAAPTSPRPGGMSLRRLCRRIDEPGAPGASELVEQAGQLTEALGRTARLGRGDRACPASPHLERRPAAAGRRVRRRVGRVRPGAQVPPDDEPRAGPAGRAGRRRRRRARSVVTTTLDAMASGGIYDHLGGGFARYSVDDALAGPPLREDALRPGAAGPRLPARLAGHRRRPLPPGARRDDRLRARATCATPTAGSTRPRTPTREGEEGRFYVWTPGAGRRRRSAPELAPTRARVVRRHRRRATSRAAPSSTAPVRGDLRAAARRSRRPGRRCSPPARERVRPGLDDKVLTEWNAPDAGRPGRGGRRHRATTDWLDAAVANGRVPARRPAPRRRPLAALVAGRRRGPPPAPTPPTTPPWSTPSTRLAEATGEARWIDEARAVGRRAARPVLGRRQRRRCSPPADDAEALVARQKDLLDNATPGGQPPGRGRPAPPGRPHRRAPLPATRPSRSCSCSAGSSAAHPTAFGHLLAAVDLLRAGVDRDRRRRRPARPAWPPCSARYLPNAVLAWGERYDSPLWEGRDDGPRLRLPRLRLPGAGRLGRGPGRSARGLTT